MRRNQGIWDRYERTAYKHFGEAAARYLREFDGKDKRRTALALASTHPYIGTTPLIDVNDGSLERFKDDRLNGKGAFERKAMAGTVNKELTVVTTVLNRACRDWDWIPRVPRIRSVKGPVRTAYPINWEEQDRLFSCLPTTWEKGCALFAVNTGVRKAELFGLKWSDMVAIPELETFVFILRGTKNGQDRAVICNSMALQAVNYQRDNGSQYVFPSRWQGNKGGRIRQSGKIWAKAWIDAGLPSDRLVRKGIHNLRHTYGHRLRAAGVPEEDRAALLGHNNTSLVQHYAMPDIERLLAASEKVTERKDTVILRAVQSA
jgi:integrase